MTESEKNTLTDLQASMIQLLEHSKHSKDTLNRVESEIGEVKVDVKEISSALYNPSAGAFARIQCVEKEVIPDGKVRMSKSEETLKSMKRYVQIAVGAAITSVVGLVIGTLIAAL
jgi:hypothetical protein